MKQQNHDVVGFIGLGTMGEPMACNLVRAGFKVIVWNRTSAKAQKLEQAGAEVADSVKSLFARTRIIILMLSNEAAINAVLPCDSPEFDSLVHGHTLVQMATIAPDYSLKFSQAISAAGGTYIEAPVSGQRQPAEKGQLVAMVSGEAGAAEVIAPLLAPLCRQVIFCGPVPQALLVKLTSNLFVGLMTAALAEMVCFGRKQGVNLDLLSRLLVAGPMSSELLRMKLPGLLAGDYRVQASLANAKDSIHLIQQSAQASRTATPLADTFAALIQRAIELGHAQDDITAVACALDDIKAISLFPHEIRHN